MKITRSFTRRIQLKQFEPIESVCAVEVEVDPLQMEKESEFYGEFCRSEAEKTIEWYKGNPRDTAKSKDVGMDDAINDLPTGVNDF